MKLLVKSITFIIILAITACSGDFTSSNVELGNSYTKRSVDVIHTPTERQSIGNCWIYAQATWVESMHKRATGEDIDISQSSITGVLRVVNDGTKSITVSGRSLLKLGK